MGRERVRVCGRCRAGVRAAATAALVASCAPPRPPAPVVVRPEPPPVRVEAPRVLATPRASRVAVVYREAFPATPRAPYDAAAEMVGLDRAHHVAVLRVRRGARRALEAIDVAREARVATWEITGTVADPDVAPPRGDGPGAPGPGLFAYAERLARVEPWTAPPLAGIGHAAIAVGPGDDGYVVYQPEGHFRVDEDMLYAVRRAPTRSGAGGGGGAPVLLSRGLRAAYEPVFAPDGARVAFRGLAPGCEPEYERNGVHDCVYGLFVTRIGDRAPSRVRAVMDPEWYAFSRDGATLYALSHDHRAIDRPCVYRASTADPARADALLCVDDVQDNHRVRPMFVVDPARETGVLIGRARPEGPPDDEAPPGRAARYHWFRLADGARLASGTLEGGSRAILGPDGVMCTHAPDALTFVDLRRGVHARVPVERGAFDVVGFHRAAWLDRSHLLTVRGLVREGSGWAYELVTVDGDTANGAPVAR